MQFNPLFGPFGRDHCRSCDKDGGNTIPSAIAENAMLCHGATEPELLPMKAFYSCNANFVYF